MYEHLLMELVVPRLAFFNPRCRSLQSFSEGILRQQKNPGIRLGCLRALRLKVDPAPYKAGEANESAAEQSHCAGLRNCRRRTVRCEAGLWTAVCS